MWGKSWEGEKCYRWNERKSPVNESRNGGYIWMVMTQNLTREQDYNDVNQVWENDSKK
jgi:hypothetical protein